jgi:NAD(P)-dependent dehydrogenase (short-subunit alcohol dehydrogenase family)
VVNTASDAHQIGRINFDDMQSVKAWRSTLFEYVRYGGSPFKVYGFTKLCNILFTRELARRLKGTGATANCVHPGFVATRFGGKTGGVISFGIGVAKRFALTVEKGAETIVYLASSPEVEGISGEYFHNRQVIAPTAAARDDETARRLWAESARLAGITEQPG